MKQQIRLGRSSRSRFSITIFRILSKNSLAIALFLKDVPYEFTYMFCIMFCICIDIPVGAKQLTLPENSRVVVLAATVTNDQNNQIIPPSDILRIALPEKGAGQNSHSKTHRKAV